MIKKSAHRRYANLIKYIRNWERYLLNKVLKKERLTYRTRNNNWDFDVPSYLGGIFKEIFLDDIYEVKRLMKSNLNNSSIIFDIGANAGFFSIFLTENINPKEIHCFEPLPNNFKLLEKNLRAGNDSQCKFILNNKAVVKPGINSIKLHYDGKSEFSPTASTVKGFDVTNKSICVRAVNIETYCEENRIEKIDFLKMDCEGAEYDIFYNLSASFFEKTSHIYMETHDLDNFKNNTRSLDEFFNQSGFTTQVSSINDHTAMLWAEKQDSSSKSLNTAAHPC